MNPYLGEIKIFAGNFAPRGYALCNGQLLPIAQNNALFALLGTTYGGNGTTTFALPNLQGRLPLHAGSGAGLPTYPLGTVTGTEAVTLTTATIPTHTHTLNGSTGAAGTASPTAASLAVPARRIYSTTGGTQALSPGSVGNTGNNASHPNLQPYLVLTFIIATAGIFPSRN